MKKIRDIFLKPIDRTIEEVIKVDQDNEQVVLNELNEYVVTDSIKTHFRDVYKEIAEAPSDPREGIGIWISGFFGSGKSSFAKILGYTVAAKKVGDRSASDIFKETVGDEKISGLIDNINARIPTRAVIFDVSMDRGVRTANERITEIMYKALLRELGYAEDFDLALLEITLEGDGKLDEFIARFEEIYGKPWIKRRKLGLAINEASRVLHEMDPGTYTSPDSYARSLGKGREDIDANKLSGRCFELAGRRAEGKTLIFIIDEVGQYVSRSVEKMLDLQGVVQAIGKESYNRIKAKKATAPIWIVVTSQEKLNEVVDALDSKKIELARLMDRFRISLDLKSTDIAEIAGRRILAKKKEAENIIGKLYDDNTGRLKSYCVLERTSRDLDITRNSFIELYPYLPYQIELSINIVSGLRLRRGAQRHIGGSNRTIIKQAQQMMINPRTMLADAPIGTLVTLDKVYELLEVGNLLSSEVSREIDAIPNNLPHREMAVKAAKAIVLLEVVKDLPRTPHNIAVTLHPSVTAESIQSEVEDALQTLEDAQVIRNSEEGYKLLTVQEKNWDIKRKELDPKERDRHRIIRETIREIFSDPQVRTYRYKNLRPFRCSLTVEGEKIESDGEILLNTLLADDGEAFTERGKEARESSSSSPDEVFWVTTMGDEIHGLINELYRSQVMISDHERLASQNQLTSEESSCLSEEKARRDTLQRKFRVKVSESLAAGSGFFRGVQRDGSAMGDDIGEVIHKILDIVVPDLYPKLEMGVRTIKGDEPEKFLTAANLNGLPPIFYDGENGLSLVLKQGNKFVPNVGAEICKEVLDYMTREHSYGNKVTGKNLEVHFQGVGYGWDRDVLRLALAALFRGGAIEVTYQGRKYRNHHDPAARKPFTNTPSFRGASFAPRERLDLKLLAAAARQYEELTGQEVNIEEGAIAAAFQKEAARDREEVLPLAERMKALKMPGTDFITAHLLSIQGILEQAPDDCVRTLAGEGKSYGKTRERVDSLAAALTDENVEFLKKSRKVLEEKWPILEARQIDDGLKEKADLLSEAIKADDFYSRLESIRQAAQSISTKYDELYREKHNKRTKLYAKALEEVKGFPEWAEVALDKEIPDSKKEAILNPLSDRACPEVELSPEALTCANCRTGIDQLETDASIVDALQDQVIRDVQSLAAPEVEIERVRVSRVLSGRLETEEDVEKALQELRDHLLKLIAQGVTVILE